MSLQSSLAKQATTLNRKCKKIPKFFKNISAYAGYVYRGKINNQGVFNLHDRAYVKHAITGVIRRVR